MDGFTTRRLLDAASLLLFSFLLALGASAGVTETGGEDPLGDSGRTFETAPQTPSDPWTREAPALENAETSKRVVPKAKPANRVSGIDAVDVGGGVLVRVEADGKIGLTRTRSLEDPPRLVVDLPGLKTDPDRREISLDSEWVRSVTLSSLPGRLRLELEGSSATSDFSDRRLVPRADGLWVAIGDSPKLEQAMDSYGEVSTSLATALSSPVAPVPGELSAGATLPDEQEAAPAANPESSAEGSEQAAEPQGTALTAEGGPPAQPESTPELSPASPPVEVVGVKYSSQPNRERIVVLARSPLTYEVRKPNSETVVIRLPGAVIDADAEGRIEPPPGGPIELVTSFQQPEVSPKEVRIVVKTDAGVSPELASKGSLLFIDFPKQGSAARTSKKGDAGESSEAAGGRAFVEEIEPMLNGSQDSEPGSVRRADAALDSEWQRTAKQPFEKRSATATVPAAPASTSVAHPSDLLREGGLSEGKVYTGRRISLDFKDVPVSDVLRLVAEVSNLNVVAGDEVKGK
ncbi:MAG: AMIN domain-containing protein, partial [Myxococcota bacterium]|nr:AMIN domain-containing protein [Myxococcota bacterium]